MSKKQVDKSLLDAVEYVAKQFDKVDEVKAEAKEIEEKQEKAAADGITTTNTGLGAEYARDNEYTSQLYSMVVAENDLLQVLPWNHGQRNAPSITVNIKGVPRLMKKGSQGSGSNGSEMTGTQSHNTDEVVISIGKFKDTIFVSHESMQYYAGQWTLLQNVQNEIKEAMKETVNAVIINADTQTNITTGNVNKKTNGANPVALDTTQYFLTLDNGTRKVGIANTVVAAAALSRTTYSNCFLAVGDYAADYKNLLWIASADAATRARTIDGYETIDKFGTNASNVRGGFFERIEGVDMFVTRHLASAVAADGYIETGDSAANTKSQIQLLYKPAVQYAMGHDPVIVPRQDADGWYFDYAMWFGFVLANEVAGLDKTVATAILNKS